MSKYEVRKWIEYWIDKKMITYYTLSHRNQILISSELIFRRIVHLIFVAHFISRVDGEIKTRLLYNYFNSTFQNFFES